MSICYVYGFHNARETREALAKIFRDLINDKLNEPCLAAATRRWRQRAPAGARRQTMCVWADACVCWGRGTGGSGLQEEEAMKLGEAWRLVAEVR